MEPEKTVNEHEVSDHEGAEVSDHKKKSASSWLANWSIGKRILCGFIIVTGLTAVAGVTGIVNINTIGNAMDRVAYDEAPTVDAANEMKIAMALARNAMEEYKGSTSTIASADESVLEEILAAFKQTVVDFDGFAGAILEGGEYDGVVVPATDNDHLRELVEQADAMHNDKFQPASDILIQAGKDMIAQKVILNAAMLKMETIFDEVQDDMVLIENAVKEIINKKKSSLSTSAIRILERDVPLADMAMELKNTLSISRIKLEEINQMTTAADVEGLQAEYIQTIKDFDTWIFAILDGAVTSEGRVYATTDAGLRAMVLEVDDNHTDFQAAADALIKGQLDMIGFAAVANEAMDNLDNYGVAISDILDDVEGESSGEMAEAVAIASSAKTTANITLILVTLISVALGIGIGLFISNGITRPINKMIAVLTDIEQGEGDLTKRLNMEAKDEIGIMARLFDSFLAKTQKLIKDIGVSSDQVDQASTNISASSEQLAAGSEEQQAQLSEVSTTMEEMSAMILESSSTASSTRASAQEASRTAEEGRETVAKTVIGFEKVVNTVRDASKQIQELDKRSEEIGNVIQVIDDIADQTNLLALNANIEAARAGEAGRGFAVVADEVRKLAERTVSATSEIGLMIETIQSDIKDAVKSMGEIQELSNSGLELVSKSDTALGTIAGSVSNIVGSIEQIATSGTEQSTGAEEISKNIEGVATVAKQSASSAQELASSAEQLNNEIQTMNSLIGQFKV